VASTKPVLSVEKETQEEEKEDMSKDSGTELSSSNSSRTIEDNHGSIDLRRLPATSGGGLTEESYSCSASSAGSSEVDEADNNSMQRPPTMATMATTMTQTTKFVNVSRSSKGPMQFSIDSYDSRDRKEVPYHMKLARTESLNSSSNEEVEIELVQKIDVQVRHSPILLYS
jgi:hypothetical protein